MADIIELTVKGKDEVVAYVCGVCHNVVSSAQASPHADEINRHLAATHCDKCCGHCDTPLPHEDYFYVLCDACRLRANQEREQAEFEKATKLKEKDYQGDVPLFYPDDHFFFDNNVEEFREWWCNHHYDPANPDADPPPFPMYIWLTEPTKGPSLDAYDIVRNALEEFHEDAYDECDVEELQTLLDAWCEKNEVTTWFQSNTLVLLDENKNRKYLEEVKKDA